MNGPNIQNHSLMLSEYLHNIQYIDITIPSNSIFVVFKIESMLNFGKLLGLTFTLFATTADDAIWLIPYMKESGVLFYGLVFCLGLQTIVWGSWLLVSLFGDALRNHPNLYWGLSVDEFLGVIAAVLCWFIALYLLIKKLRRKRLPVTGDGVAVDSYGTILKVVNNDTQDESRSMKHVYMMSLLGSLDEASYFPSLLLGKFCTVEELSLTAFIACVAVLVAVTVLRGTCGPALHFFDRMPSYGVVALFATLLTGSVGFDIYRSR